MSPEEFDNRLRSTFKDESLPPREHLWQNITTSLEQKQGSGTVWYWLAPVLIACFAGIAWLTITITQHDGKENTVATETPATANTPAPESTAPASGSDKSSIASNPSNTSALASGADNNTPVQNNIATDQSGSVKPEGINNEPQSGNQDKPSQRINTGNAGRHSSNDIAHSANERSNSVSENNSPSNTRSFRNNNTGDEETFNHLKLNFFQKFNHNLGYDEAETEKASLYTVNIYKPVSNTKVYEPGYFEGNTEWISFGLGTIKAKNTFVSYMDPTYKVHKDLWSNRNKLVSNGAGVNIFVNYQKKFGFRKRFSYELGLNFTSRTEDIRLNEYSYDIAYRNNDTIVRYFRTIAWAVMPGGDTNFFNLASSFVQISKNRYNVFTLPLKFNYEQPISEHTFFSLGVGGGVSLITTRSAKHIDLVQETEFSPTHRTQIKASINPVFSLYTNYNSLGQIGVYCGYQMYLGDYKLNNQYGMKISDMQYGLIFRRPLRF